MSGWRRELQCMSGQDKEDFNWWKAINKRWPYLKVIMIGLILVGVGLNFLGVGVKRVGETVIYKVPKVSKEVWVKVPERPWRVLEGKKLVALTFDDGPDPVTTPKLLKFLYDQNVSATFFMLGFRARDNVDLVKWAGENHEIGSHTMWHNNLTKLSVSEVRADIQDAKGVFKHILGQEPILMRPPYGAINRVVRENAGGIMIGWTVDTLDWQHKNPVLTVQRVMEQVFDGAIILMHDIHATSVEAVPTVVEKLREAGYEFVTVSELAKIKGESLKRGVFYGSF